MTREEKSIQYIKQFEPKEGYYVAFSGGKDSVVIYDLVKQANVKYDVHHSITTIDPPEFTKWFKKTFPEVQRHKPKLSMFELVEKKGVLPTRINRFCCAYLKETGGRGRVVMLGVRRAESTNRSNRNLFDWNDTTKKLQFNPIIDWSDRQVWGYIKQHQLEYSPLYDKGQKRIGCVACPMISGNLVRKELEKYPHIKKGYARAINKAMQQGKFKQFQDSEEVFEWWHSDLSTTNYFESKKQIGMNI